MTAEAQERQQDTTKPTIESGIFEGSSFPDRIGTYPNGQDQMVWDREGATVALDEAGLSVDTDASTAFQAVAYELGDGTVLAYTPNRQFTITENPDGSKTVTVRERLGDDGVKDSMKIPSSVTVGETQTKHGTVKRISVFSGVPSRDAEASVSQGQKLLWGRGHNSGPLERALTQPTNELTDYSDVLQSMHLGDERLTIEQHKLGADALAAGGIRVTRKY
jgi:hypothetical protein